MSRDLDLQRIAYEFAYQVVPTKFLDHWEQNRESLKGCRLVFSDPRLDSPFPGRLSARAFGSKPQAHLNALFAGPGFFFLNDELVQKHKYGSDLTSPKLDWSVSLDSNVVGDVHKFMTGKSLDAKWPAFLDVATYLLKHGINTDATPYLYENFHKARNDPKHLDFVVHGFASFYRFTTGRALTTAPSTLSDFEFAISKEEAARHARTVVNGMLNDSRMMQEEVLRLWHRQDAHFALLLIATEYYENRYSTLKEKMLWLVEMLEKVVGRIPDRELMFALDAFGNHEKKPFFKDQWPIRYNRKQNIVDLVRNMSWDISFFRTMQTWATSKVNGDFSIPYFLTFDWRLAGMNDIYSCRILLIDDQNERVYSLPQSNFQLQLKDVGCWEAIEPFFAEERIKYRLSRKVSYEELESHCRDAEEKLHSLVYGDA